MKKIDLTKLPKYERLKIISKNILFGYYVNVMCDCGTIKKANFYDIKAGKIKSCGCLQKENRLKGKHGGKLEALYSTWYGIKQRCFYKKSNQYIRYGGRGITMCDEWKNDYTKFRDWALANGYKKELQIDRINNDGNYEPNNCRWVTSKENNNNRKTNRIVTFNKKSMTISQWSDYTGIASDTIRARLNRGWAIKDAITSNLLPNGVKYWRTKGDIQGK